MDLLQGVKDAAASEETPPENFEMPTMDQLLSAIENMKDMDEQQKSDLRESLLARAQLGEGGFEGLLKQAQDHHPDGRSVDFLMLFGLISLILFVLVFFGYKLYKSLAEKERRREEKRRQKQQKKKK